MATSYGQLTSEQMGTAVQNIPHLQQVKWNQNPTKVTKWYNQYLGGGGQDFLTTPTATTPSVPMSYGTNYPAFQNNFDPNQYLPGIQQTATSIYQPQLQALESLRQLGNTQAQTAKVSSEADFQKQLQQEIEGINQRGSFFSGGATQYTSGLQEQHARDISSLTLQAQAADFQNIAQQAGLSADQAKYIQDQLYNNQESAYNRAWQQYQQNYQMYSDQQQMAEQQRQFNANLQFDMAKYAQDMGVSKATAKLEWAKLSASEKASTAKQQQDQANIDWSKNNLTAYQQAQLAISQQNANTAEKKGSGNSLLDAINNANL